MNSFTGYKHHNNCIWFLFDIFLAMYTKKYLLHGYLGLFIAVSIEFKLVVFCVRVWYEINM